MCNGAHCVFPQGGRVRTHIGDVSRFVQFLCDAHGAGRGETEPRRCDLLQGGGGERRARGTLLCLLLHTADVPILGCTGGCQNALRLLFRFRFFDADGRHWLPRFSIEISSDDPEILWHECADLALAFHDDAERWRLHAAGGKAVAHFLPHEAREIVSEQAIEYAPCFLRLTQFLVDGAGVSKRFLHGVFGDLVEHDALGLFEFKDLGEVPCDGLAFAIGVGRKDDRIHVFCHAGKFIDDFFFAFHYLILRHETALDIDGILIALRQIAYVSNGSTHDESVAKIFFDCFRF